MNARNKAGQVLVTMGSVVLFTAAALHFHGGYSTGFPALAASNLNVGLQSLFRVMFLSVGWDAIVFGVIAAVAAFKAAAGARALVLLCGLALLIETAGGAAAVGLFIGNEMTGTAAILMIVGGSLLGSSAGQGTTGKAGQ